MARRIKVSRQGLTRCPACQAHIQIAADVRQTACPFCEAALLATPEPTPGSLHGLIRGALATGRSGLLAASLLGLSVGAAACGDEEEPSKDTSTTTDTIDDGTAQALYGAPADTVDDTATTDTVEDTGAVAEYGIPPDVVEDTVEDTGAVDLYGLPPDSSP